MHSTLTLLFHCRNSVRLAIRKLTYAPEEPAPQPNAEAVKDFIMSPGSIRLEASLDKEVSGDGLTIMQPLKTGGGGGGDVARQIHRIFAI